MCAYTHIFTTKTSFHYNGRDDDDNDDDDDDDADDEVDNDECSINITRRNSSQSEF